MQQIAQNVTRQANYKMHAKQLAVPIFKDMKPINTDDPHMIFFFEDEAHSERFASDGYIEDGQFEGRVSLRLEQLKQIMANQGCEMNYMFFKDYDNGTFKFKLYVCDTIAPNGEGKKIVREIHAYFVEPRMHDLYQIVWSVGPFPMPTETLKPGVIDLENDAITAQQVQRMQIIMDGVKYRDQSGAIS